MTTTPSEPAAGGQRRRRRIALTPDERDAFLGASRVCRVASLGPHGEPDVTPLWFVWHDGAIWLSSVVRSQRWANLLRDPRVAVVVDDGETYEQLRGVELVGRAAPVGEVPRASADRPELDGVEQAYAAKYGVDRDHLYDGHHAWLRVDVERELSWDHRKIPTATGASAGTTAPARGVSS